MAPKRRPLVNTAPVSEFGAAQPEDFKDPTHQDHDLLYVPGFSEMRKQVEIERGEYARGERYGNEVSTLPVNVRWVARTRIATGQPDSRKVMASARNGYTPVNWNELKDKPPAWLTGLPPGAKVTPDGTIVNSAGDLELHVTTANVARKNFLRKERAREALSDAVGSNLGEGAEGLSAVAKRYNAPVELEQKPMDPR